MHAVDQELFQPLFALIFLELPIIGRWAFLLI